MVDHISISYFSSDHCTLKKRSLPSGEVNLETLVLKTSEWILFVDLRPQCKQTIQRAANGYLSPFSAETMS